MGHGSTSLIVGAARSAHQFLAPKGMGWPETLAQGITPLQMGIVFHPEGRSYDAYRTQPPWHTTLQMGIVFHPEGRRP